MTKRLLSASQPTGLIHIGNYFGAIKQWADMQHDYESFAGIVDLHALTIPFDPAELKRRTLDLAKVYVAAGIDPDRTAIFLQSKVPQHTELAWILGTLSYMGELECMTQYKEKAEKQASANLGLFSYPVLMAADILLYDADVVPVGEDQKQHVELTRNIAERFNNRFGQTFIVPEHKVLKSIASRLRALDNPEKKMSKSGSANNYIGLLDTADEVRAKIKVAVTDSENEVRFDLEQKPGVSNLLTIYSLTSDKSVEEAEQGLAGQNYGALKQAVTESVIAYLQPLQEKYHEVSDEQAEAILEKGSERAREVAEKTMQRVREKIGLLR